MKNLYLFRHFFWAALVAGLLSYQTVLAFGELDTSFGFGGIIYDTGPSYLPNAIARQSDGKILVAGFGLSEYGYTVLVLRRFNSNGTVDTNFGNNGSAIPYNIYGYANNLYVQTDGKIVVAGGVSSTVSYGAVWRFDSDGWYDASFGYFGRTLLNSNNACQAAAYYPSPSVAPEMIAACSPKLYRLRNNGTLNTAFGSGGSVTAAITVRGTRSLLVKQGTFFSEPRIYIAGNQGQNPAIARYLINGQLDQSYGAGGVFAQTTFAACAEPYISASYQYKSLALQSGGKIIAFGSLKFQNVQNYQEFQNRHLANGDFDETFTGGFSNTCHGVDGIAHPETIKILSDNKILRATSDTIIRQTAEGEADASFLTATGSNRDFLVQPDGKIVVVSSSSGQLSRYLP